MFCFLFKPGAGWPKDKQRHPLPAAATLRWRLTNTIQIVIVDSFVYLGSLIDSVHCGMAIASRSGGVLLRRNRITNATPPPFANE